MLLVPLISRLSTTTEIVLLLKTQEEESYGCSERGDAQGWCDRRESKGFGEMEADESLS